MTKQQALRVLEQFNQTLPELRNMIESLPGDDISGPGRKVRRTRAIDDRLFKPIEELKETEHVKRFIRELTDVGTTMFTSTELLLKLVPNKSDHSIARKAVLRYILTGLGYEQTSVRLEGKIVKRWRLK